MANYKLAAALRGHTDDVRGVAFPNPNVIFSASRDATVRQWKIKSPSPPTYEGSVAIESSAAINSLAYISPSTQHSDGMIVASGNDTIIEVRQPEKALKENAGALLCGHSMNVSALDVSEDGKMIASGGWDSEARVWKGHSWGVSTVLHGHTGSVWAIVIYDTNTIITGCADGMIRIFTPSGKLLRSIQSRHGVARALCKLKPTQPSSAQFASAGNDTIIRLWSMDGREVAQLKGHDAFIYSLVELPTGELASSSEDRSVRIWRRNQCIQTITHPAQSVWAVSVCPETGDIVTGASDKIVRVFSRSEARQADAADIREFENSVKAYVLPQQQVGNINKEELPGPEFVETMAGTNDGQVQMILERNGNITAYQWSSGTQKWDNVGIVVDSVGSSVNKTEYENEQYDFVFDVDVEDGRPKLKLPFNVTQNPYDAASKFIARNKLPSSYLEEIVNFLINNTKGVSIGQSSNAQGSDPWGTDSRYIPGEVASSPQQQAPVSSPKVLPQKEYVTLTNTVLKRIQEKILEFNQELQTQSVVDLILTPLELENLGALVTYLQDHLGQSVECSTPTPHGTIDLTIKIATAWPPENRIPGLDLLRLLATYSSEIATRSENPDGNIVDILDASGAFNEGAPPNNTMLAIRTFTNIFGTESGRSLMDVEFKKIHQLVSPFLKSCAVNRNLSVAISTLYINFAVLVSKAKNNSIPKLTLMEDIICITKAVTDAESFYRALVCAGTLLHLGEQTRMAAKELREAMTRGQDFGNEARIQALMKEIRGLLG